MGPFWDTFHAPISYVHWDVCYLTAVLAAALRPSVSQGYSHRPSIAAAEITKKIPAFPLSGLTVRPYELLNGFQDHQLILRKPALLIPVGFILASQTVQGCSPDVCDLDLKTYFGSSTYLFGAMVPSGAQKRAQQVWNDYLCNLQEYLENKR